MPRRIRSSPVQESDVGKVKQLLDALDLKGDPDLRRKVRSLIPVMQEVRQLGCNLILSCLADTARDRILVYLKQYPLTLIDGDELLIVSGIGDWPRRVRELRVQFGWNICSGVTFKEMAEQDPDNASSIAEQLGVNVSQVRPDQYVLIDDEQDRDAAHRWNLLNNIRRKPINVKMKLLEYFRANAGKAVSMEELRYLADKNNDWPRRIRELRTEEGWPIYTRVSGRDNLPVGAYVLDEDKQAPEHDRRIPDDVRVAVLERDGFACVVCGWKREMHSPDDPRKLLELHHLTEHKAKGANTVENLVTICNVDHDQVHARRLAWDGAQWTKTQR